MSITAKNKCRIFAASNGKIIAFAIIPDSPRVFEISPRQTEKSKVLIFEKIMLEINLTKNTNDAIQGTLGKYYGRVEYKGTLGVRTWPRS